MEDGWNFVVKGSGKGGKGAGGGGGGGFAGGGRSGVAEVALGGPRDPHWQCSKCPFEHNWA